MGPLSWSFTLQGLGLASGRHTTHLFLKLLVVNFSISIAFDFPGIDFLHKFIALC